MTDCKKQKTTKANGIFFYRQSWLPWHPSNRCNRHMPYRTRMLWIPGCASNRCLRYGTVVQFRRLDRCRQPQASEKGTFWWGIIIHDCVAVCRFDNHGFHLEIQFGSDSHEQLHVQIVVVRDKGLSGSTSGNHVHHGRFDLEESHVVEKSADVRDDLRANVKLLSHVRIDNKVQVALPEAGFLWWKQRDNR